MSEEASPQSRLRKIRLVLWAIVALAIVGSAALFLLGREPAQHHVAPQATLGGPFTLVGADGKPFSSARLNGRPHAIYFGFTRCGDVCPTTLGRLAELRRATGGERSFDIVFVTIDPAHDGPKEVGQYAGLFNTSIIGLTGSQAQIDRVKKQYGIFAEPSLHPTAGKEMDHSSMVLLFDRNGKFVSTISSGEPDAEALAKLKQITA